MDTQTDNWIKMRTDLTFFLQASQNLKTFTPGMWPYTTKNVASYVVHSDHSYHQFITPSHASFQPAGFCFVFDVACMVYNKVHDYSEGTGAPRCFPLWTLLMHLLVLVMLFFDTPVSCERQYVHIWMDDGCQLSLRKWVHTGCCQLVRACFKRLFTVYSLFIIASLLSSDCDEPG